MADGEGVVEEVLVKGRYDGSEIEKGIPESIDKGVAGAKKPIQDFNKELARMARVASPELMKRYAASWKATGMSVKEAASILQEAGYTTEETRGILENAGHTSKKVTGAFKELGIGVSETEGAFQRVAKSIQWAAYRFLTTLIIYQAFRKILRSINEAITESIRLWKEYSQQQTILKANLDTNQRLMGDTVGTLEEWNKWIDTINRTYGGGVRVWTEVVSALQAHNRQLKLTVPELQALAEVGAAVAQMWGMQKEGQLDYVKGMETVIDAIEGGEEALAKLSTTEEEIIVWSKEQGVVWTTLTDAGKARMRQIYLTTEAIEGMTAATKLATGSSEQWLRAADTAMEQYTIALGEYAVKSQLLQKLLALGWRIVAFNIADAFDKYIIPKIEQTIVWLVILQNAFPGLAGAIQPVVDILHDFALSSDEAEGEQLDLGDALKESQKETLKAARAWSFFMQVLEGGKGIVQDITNRVREMMDEIKEAAQPYIDLGKAIGDAVLDKMRAAEDAARDFGRRMADLTADLIRDIAKLNRRFADREAELVIRAEERKEEIKEEFRKREEEERDDLNLRLKHMEEDFLLDMKHMREQYEMDFEEAARTRDAVTMRKLQRQYGLERKQRGEDYQLQRSQFIESWNQRHKEREKDLNEELKEVEDNLAKQLEALEREKQRELEELKIRHAERQEELRQQYAQEQTDLQRNLERKLADILAAAVLEGTIRIDEATKVTNTLATLYGVDKQNIEDMVKHDVEWLGAWSSAWSDALAAIAKVRSIIVGKSQETMSPKIPISFAKGGMAIATSPTLVKVGDAGPELFTAIPLGKGGSVLGGIRNRMSGDFNLTIDGNQSTQWSAGFESQVAGVVADIFREAFEE